MSDELTDMLGQIAREESPPPLAADDLDVMIGAALESEEQPSEPAPKTRSTARWWLAAAAVALLALGGGYLLGGRTTEPPPLEARLPSGDVLTASPGARFEVLEPGPVVRRLELREGRVLFDVAPLGGDGSFEVQTPDGVVRVRGTVFSVEAGAQTTVRVYEGEVEVERTGTAVSLEAGEMWRAGERVAWEPGALAGEAAAAVAARTERTPRVATADPSSASALGFRNSESQSVSALGSRNSESESASALGFRNSESASASESESESALGSRNSASESESASESTEPPGPEPRPATRADVRGWLAAGDYGRARSVAARRGFTLLEADALRALGRHGDAADRYDRVAARGDGTAAFEAAQLRFRRLGDPEGALASLRSAPTPAALGERSLGLEARLLLRLGRSPDARAVAERYLERYPAGGLASWMTQLRDGAE